MKDFFKYFLIGIIVLPVLFLCSNVKALSWTSSYGWCAWNDSTQTENCLATGYRGGDANKVNLFGKETYAPTYDKWESFTGVRNQITQDLTAGTTYTFTINITYSNLSVEEFTYDTLHRYQQFATFSAGTITNVSWNYSIVSNSCNRYAGTDYCTWSVAVVYTIVPTSNVSSFILGSYNSNGSTIGLFEHYLESVIRVSSISFVANSDNTIINQNETIINNTQNINNNINSVNDNINNLNDNISDDNVSGAESELNNVINNNAFNDSSGLSSIISMPLTLVNGLSSTCQPISITIPYMNYDFTIPCISSILSSKVPTIYTTLKIVINGVIIYFVLLDMYRIIKNAKNPDDDRIEVLDL